MRFLRVELERRRSLMAAILRNAKKAALDSAAISLTSVVSKPSVLSKHMNCKTAKLAYSSEGEKMET